MFLTVRSEWSAYEELWLQQCQAFKRLKALHVQYAQCWNDFRKDSAVACSVALE